MSAFGRDLHHHGAGLLAGGAGLKVRVEISGSTDEEALGVVDGGPEAGIEVVAVFRKGFDRDAMDSELEIGRGFFEGLPGVTPDRKGLIKFQRKSVKEGSVGVNGN